MPWESPRPCRACVASTVRSPGTGGSAAAAVSPISANPEHGSATQRSSSGSVSLAIPPAWTDVWICPDAERPSAGGRDRRSRAAPVPVPPAVARQRATARSSTRCSRSRERLPKVRRRSTKLVDGDGLPAERVLAARSALCSTAGLFRVGSDEYADEQRQLRTRHARTPPRPASRTAAVVFDYVGKTGKQLRRRSVDRRLHARRRGAEAAPATGGARSSRIENGRDWTRCGRRRSTPSSRSWQTATSRRRTSAPGTRP